MPFFVSGETYLPNLKSSALQPRLLALAIATATASPSFAADFDLGPVSVNTNGSLSAGVISSVEDADGDWVNAANASLVDTDLDGEPNPSGAYNTDDGRLNWESGDIVSAPVTLLGEADFRYENFGVFLRGKAWYDYVLENTKVPHGHSSNGYAADSELDDSDFHDLAQFKGVALLDAYVYGDFDVGDVPLHVRLGNQVVNWGEGLFFRNGINSINPVDVAALRRPGSQLKEALLPTPLLYFNAGVTDKLSVEGFYQLAWQETVLEGCGTYFAVNDYFPEGCFGVARPGNGYEAAFGEPYNDRQGYARGSYVNRGENNEPGDSGQFGLAMRYFDYNLGAEFGLYAMQIHSRTPSPSVNLAGDSRQLGMFGNTPGVLTGWYSAAQAAQIAQAAGDPSLASELLANNPEYFADYAEDIRIFGVSVSGNLFGASVFAEYSFRPNQPITLHTGDSIPAVFGATAVIDSLGAPLTDDVLEQLQNEGPGSIYEAYTREKVSQFSVGTIKTFSQVLGADNLAFVGEVGMKWVHDLPDLSEARYGRADAFGSNLADGQGTGSPGCALGVSPRYQSKVCDTNDGFVSDFSWGYRMRGQLNYQGLIAGINVSPFAAFGHDVEGYSYDGNFIEDRLLGSLGVKANYLNKYSTELTYVTTGNSFWAKTDRDYVSLSARVNF